MPKILVIDSNPASENAAFVARGQRAVGEIDARTAGDMQVADRDAAAAHRLGVRAVDMAPQVRMTELRNWLASL